MADSKYPKKCTVSRGVFLNGRGHHSDASAFFQTTLDQSDATTRPWGSGSLAIRDCDRKITLSLEFGTPEEFKNSRTKLRRLADLIEFATAELGQQYGKFLLWKQQADAAHEREKAKSEPAGTFQAAEAVPQFEVPLDDPRDELERIEEQRQEELRAKSEESKPQAPLFGGATVEEVSQAVQAFQALSETRMVRDAFEAECLTPTARAIESFTRRSKALKEKVRSIGVSLAPEVLTYDRADRERAARFKRSAPYFTGMP